MGRRKNGQGLIRQRKDGRWEGRCVVGYDEKNLPITKNVLAKTKREVEEKLKALKETVQKPVVKTAADMPFGEYIDYWYRNFCELSIAATTRLKYENDIYKHIIPGIGKLPLAALKKSDLEKFYAEQMKSGNLDRNGVGDKKLSGAVIRSMHTRIKCALDQALKEGLVNRNEAIGCKLPPKKNKEIEVLSHEEIARLLIQAKEEGFYELILLGLATGMRRGELLGLKWDDINFTTGELSIRREYTTLGSDYIISTPKTKSSVRSVHLPQSVLNILGEYRKTVSSEWVFPVTARSDASAQSDELSQSAVGYAGARRMQSYPVPRSTAYLLNHGTRKRAGHQNAVRRPRSLFGGDDHQRIFSCDR